jgi:hypothetical protein
MSTLREAAQQFVADYESGGCGHFAAYAERFRKLLAQEEQKPKAWMLTDDSGMRFVSVDRPHPDFVPLYTAPPRREWRGLKEWEINDGLYQLPPEDVCSWSFRQGVYFAEKALKERNA